MAICARSPNNCDGTFTAPGTPTGKPGQRLKKMDAADVLEIDAGLIVDREGLEKRDVGARRVGQGRFCGEIGHLDIGLTWAFNRASFNTLYPTHLERCGVGLLASQQHLDPRPLPVRPRMIIA
jgi:hypothetical protein